MYRQASWEYYFVMFKQSYKYWSNTSCNYTRSTSCYAAENKEQFAKFSSVLHNNDGLLEWVPRLHKMVEVGFNNT